MRAHSSERMRDNRVAFARYFIQVKMYGGRYSRYLGLVKIYEEKKKARNGAFLPLLNPGSRSSRFPALLYPADG